ncbi:MAG: hypothetical protein IT580_14230 [Verrucomicrobiales bacterium]|nr:hypothetical protein [Verrucomicrobiales bacterium]
MRTALRFTAMGVLVFGTVFWLFGGPHLGWTKTQVPVSLKDPVTELEYTEWRSNFVPGVDFLGGCVLLSALIGAAGWLIPQRRRPSTQAPA